MPVNEIFAFSSAIEMLEALRDRVVSACELLELHLKRIAFYNPRLNVIVTKGYEEAWRAAKACDEGTRGRNGAFQGLPVTIKDCIHTKGLPTTGGIPERASAIAVNDARLTARIRGAGAVIMGKTNVPPFASDWQCDNALFGRTNNPWNLTHTPGGSTGGAAAVAAGLTPLEFGGDFAGSIRIPASFCGVYGHKPSETAVARSGHFPGSELPNAAKAMSVQGPIARTAEDLELALDVVAGPDVGEDVAWRLSLPSARHKRLVEYRVAIMPPITWQPVDREIIAAVERVAAVLGRAGARVRQAQPDSFGDVRSYFELYLSIFWALATAGQDDDQRDRHACRCLANPDEFVQSYARGLKASASEYLSWFAERERHRAAYRAFFREWDVLIAPANIVNAFPHTNERHLKIDGDLVRYDRQLVYPALATLTGQPATAFPVGLNQLGLPVGLQVIGPYLEDRTPIHFAALVARELGGYSRPAGFDVGTESAAD